MIDLPGLRSRLEQTLGKPVPESIWQQLVEERYTEEIFNRVSGAWPELVKRTRRLIDLRKLDEPRSQGGLQGTRPARPTRPHPRLQRMIGRGHRVEQEGPADAEYELDSDDVEIRREVLTMVLHRAAQDDAQPYRTAVLGGQLLAWGEMEAWLEAQAAEPGVDRPTWWLDSVPIPLADVDELVRRVRDAAGQESEPATMQIDVPLEQVRRTVQLRYLRYLVPDGEEGVEERAIPTTVGVAGEPTPGASVRDGANTPLGLDADGGVSRFPDNTLESLRLLSEYIGRKYGWTPAEATVFVLTDLAPHPRAVSFQYVARSLPSLPYIQLQVDPIATADEVAEEYRRVRQELLVGMGGRQRSITAKEIALMWYVANFPEYRPIAPESAYLVTYGRAKFKGRPPRRQKGDTWQDRMDGWNRAAPTYWKYSQASNFQRDCDRVARWLVRPYELPDDHR